MRKIFLLTILSFLFFTIEFLWMNLLGGWFKPDLLLLLIIFFNLSLGIRYGLATAFLAGVLKDSFGASVFGIHALSFVVCAFMMIVIRRYLFHAGGYSFRISLAFLMSLLNVLVVFTLNSFFLPLEIKEAFCFVMVPEVLATTLAAGFTFRQLRTCVLKFSV
ncbi:MAG TPA: rod shape-determining protein MreD [Candidatus Omnitrophota bacterium]|nr:rod shape-determining protein MreD [Candidatus Omnitrophota bacterium]